MILTLIALWVVCSVIFFGSLAIAASVPMPPIDHQSLLDDPSLKDYQMPGVSQGELAYSGTGVASRNLESMRS